MRPEIAVVGAGFSGTMVAVHLLRLARSASADVHVSLYEQDGAPGRGHAYGTTSPIHLLNVPAGRMSAFADAPGHFLEWARARDGSVQPGAFLPRDRYGEYVAEILNRETKESEGRLQIHSAEVLDVESAGEGLRLRFRTGPAKPASHVVLATGHPLPAPPVPLDRAVLDGGRYKENPWDSAALDQLPSDASLLLIGSGLTAVDVLLESRRRGFRGVIHLLSRHGLLPLPHGGAEVPRSGIPADFPRGRLLLMMKRLRKEALRAEKNGEGWRSSIDALRPATQDLWRSLDTEQKQRFLRHPRAYWEVHRHRVAPEIDEKVKVELQSGSVIRHAARIVTIDAERDALRVAIAPRGAAAQRLLVQRVINCTGPNTGVEMCRSPLTLTLLTSGACRPDEVGIGLACDADGALMDAAGRISDRLFTLGPLRKGELWESTAVPELRVQAERLARRLLNAR
ncbi:MAG TPA: FAD/NAD(P)-binding protein [Candidatus Dormibacteraeota bacterium]|nr:FAD/NAD(P)-binding protein [Candidatus Dormibacteraeota bacterium]